MTPKKLILLITPIESVAHLFELSGRVAGRKIEPCFPGAQREYVTLPQLQVNRTTPPGCETPRAYCLYTVKVLVPINRDVRHVNLFSFSLALFFLLYSYPHMSTIIPPTHNEWVSRLFSGPILTGPKISYF